MSGALEKIGEDALRTRSRENMCAKPSEVSNPFHQFQTITPVLHCSITPTTQGFKAALSVPSRGSKKNLLLWAWVLYSAAG
jgi:hypothetical protein